MCPTSYITTGRRVTSSSQRLMLNLLGRREPHHLGRRWDYLAWNKSFERVFSWEPGAEPLSRNHVWLWFMDPSRRTCARATGPEGRKELTHPVVGRLAFAHAVFHHGERSEQRPVLYSPLCEHDTPAKLARLLEQDESRLARAPKLAPALA